ncbi:MAG: 4-phosphoerythronate dehydrogenase [Ignavibacteria bacterium]|jgi:erythronate-4-phosphate dehydrogenase|nr:4-phosphoerythronate dehydrogenase [Ignavibacteria bacterium]
MIFTVDSNIPMLYDCLTADGCREKNVVNTYVYANLSNEDLRNTGTEALLCRSTIKVNEELLAGTNVKFVATATTGIDHVDTNYLQRNGIEFYATLGANSNSVAEYVVFSILYWSHFNEFSGLTDKLVGIIGYGNIGTKVARYLDLMGIRYVVCDPLVERKDGVEFCDIDELVERCEVLTMHVPSTKDSVYPTYNLLSAERIGRVKAGSLLILAARGDVYDGAALLQRGDALTYAIDVWLDEPMVKYRELIDRALIATPHIAGHSLQGKGNSTPMIIDKLNALYSLNIPKEDVLAHINDVSHPYMMDRLHSVYYMNLFLGLTASRGLIKTSMEMKANYELSDDKFTRYFKNARANYPERNEILKLPQFN